MESFSGQRLAQWPRLVGNEAHLWLISLDAPLEKHLEWAGSLCSQEQERARRFHFKQHQRDYITGRGALRHILARYLETPPRDLQFGYTAKGKPYLLSTSEEKSIQFNLAHSGRWALCGVTRKNRIGVDLEWKRFQNDLAGLARLVFSARELAALEKLPLDQQADWFYRIWTAKEAFLKAVGEGIGERLRDIELQIASLDRAVLSWSLPSLGRPEDWQLREFILPGGYQGAAMVEGKCNAWFEGLWE